MPRRKLIRTRFDPYYVTCLTNNREPISFPLDEAWEMYQRAVYEITMFFDARVHALVLLDNEYQMLISTPGRDLGVVMQRFHKGLTHRLNARAGRMNHHYNSKYRSTVLGGGLAFEHTLRFIYRTPVDLGLTHRAENYRFGTLHGLTGQSHLLCPSCIDPAMTMKASRGCHGWDGACWIGSTFRMARTSESRLARR